jgi:DNA polymerase epsilon subunit 1
MPAPRRAPQNGYRRGGKQAYHGPRKAKTFAAKSGAEATSADEKREAVRLAHSIDEAQGFARYESGKKRVGWLVNIQSTSIEDEKIPEGRAGLDCYFIEEDGSTFKATLEYDPYFLVAVKRGHESEAEEWLKRAPGGGVVKSLRKVEKEDLQMPNHLLGYRRTFFELRFANVGDLLAARRDIMPIAERNRKNMNAMDTYAEVARYVVLSGVQIAILGLELMDCSANAGFDLFDDERDDERRLNTSVADASDFIVDIREWDVPYHVRVMIDLGGSVLHDFNT